MWGSVCLNKPHFLPSYAAICAGWCLFRSAVTAPPGCALAFRGKAGPFRVGLPNSQPPFPFHDKIPRDGQCRTGRAREGPKCRYGGVAGRGPIWGVPSRGFQAAGALFWFAKRPFPVVFFMGQPGALAGHR